MTKRMFEFITRTWNPLGGRCYHDCEYCWARELAKTRKLSKYLKDIPQFDNRQVARHFRKDDFVFLQDMSDFWGSWVNRIFQVKIVEKMNETCPTQFLSLTKNPKGYMDFISWGGYFAPNIVLGATIESDRDYSDISKAPSQFDRLFWITELAKLMMQREEYGKARNRLFLSIEPILDFELRTFVNMIGNWIRPWAVAVGYDNYGHHLPEPSLEKTLNLIRQLEAHGITVYRKTLREKWDA